MKSLNSVPRTADILSNRTKYESSGLDFKLYTVCNNRDRLYPFVIILGSFKDEDNKTGPAANFEVVHCSRQICQNCLS